MLIETMMGVRSTILVMTQLAKLRKTLMVEILSTLQMTTHLVFVTTIMKQILVVEIQLVPLAHKLLVTRTDNACHLYIISKVIVIVCVCIVLKNTDSQCFSTLCLSTPLGDPWAIAISWLTLTAITRLDSVCQVQDAA